MPPIATILTEEELILLLKKQSREGYNYLYKQYSGALYGIVRKTIEDEGTASDVLQEVFVKVFRNIDQYDPKKGRLYTWMINITRNAAIDKLRSKGEIMRSKVRSDETIVSGNNESFSSELSIDTIGLRKAVATLRPEYEVVVSMAYFKGYTMDEISKTLEIPLGTVKTRMRAALLQLREIFNN